MAYNFKTNQTYNFEVYGTTILGNDYKNVLVIGIFNYKTALHFGDIDVTQVQVFPHLPSGTPNRPEEYEYLLIQTANKGKVVLARQWINESTVVQVGNSKVEVTVEEAGTADIEDIRAALMQNGYNKIDIRVVN